jgi:hypothetical protein
VSKLYYQMAEIAGVVGKSTEATRKWLLRQGIATKRGGRWVVTGGKLLASLPEVFQRLAQTGLQS